MTSPVQANSAKGSTQITEEIKAQLFCYEGPNAVRIQDSSKLGRKGAWAVDVDFRRYSLIVTEFHELNFFKCNFVDCDLTLTDFSGCVLEQCGFDEGTDFRGTIFRGSVIKQCDLTGLDLTDIEVNEETIFESVDVCSILKSTLGKKTVVSRRQLDLLRNNGGLSVGQLRNMIIRDDVSLLRSTFSGFWNSIHTFSLVIFLAPYVLFVIEQWGRAQLGRIAIENAPPNTLELTQANSTTIFANLGRFIVSGGETTTHWRFSILAIVLFVLALSIFSLRLALFVKTKLLEHYHQVHGFYPEFTLKGTWLKLHNWFKLLAMVGLLIVFIHSVMLLFHRVPQNEFWEKVLELRKAQ